MVLDASLLNTQHYKVRIKGKVEQSREGVAPSPTPWCSSYRKGSLRVTLDYGRQLYNLLIISKYEVNWFQVLVCNYGDLTPVICLHTFKWIFIYHLLVNSLVISFLNELQLICWYTCIAIISTRLNGFNYCYRTLIILFNVYHLFADSEVVTSHHHHHHVMPLARISLTLSRHFSLSVHRLRQVIRATSRILT